jgi:hypothetical protein
MKGLCKTAIIFQKMKGKSGRVKDSRTSILYIQRLILKATQKHLEGLQKNWDPEFRTPIY